jgi:hypothetical protein
MTNIIVTTQMILCLLKVISLTDIFPNLAFVFWKNKKKWSIFLLLNEKSAKGLIIFDNQ